MIRNLAGLALLPLLAGGLAACGGDDAPSSDRPAEKSSASSPASYAEAPIEQIQDDVRAAMKDVDSVHIAGSIVDADNGRITFDVRIGGDGCTGEMAMAKGGSIEILAAGGVSYFKADDAFWKAQAGAEAATYLQQKVGARWATDSTDPEGISGGLCDLDQLLSKFAAAEGAAGGSKVVGSDRVDGHPTVTLAFESDEGNPGTVHVAADAPHRVLRFDVPKEGAMTLSDYGKPVDVSKPAAADVFDLATLGS